MWILIGAVVTASLLGSLHCVGMCGPLAIWASGAGDGRSRLALNTSLYHFGRMLTYALAGLLAGLVGELTDFGGEVLGVQLAAARVVGVVMIAMGVIQVLRWAGLRWAGLSWAGLGGGATGLFRLKPNNLSSPKPSRVSKWLVSLRPVVFSLNVPTRALVTGLLTALLPCGWLYLFALVAAGTGNWLTGPVVMIAFWVGSVPALIGVVMSTKLLAGRLRQFVPVLVALMMIVAGGYTMAGRGFASLHSLAEINVSSPAGVDDLGLGGKTPEELSKSLDEIVKTPLPCCQPEQE